MDTFGGQQRQLDPQVVGDVPQRQHRSHHLQARQRPNRLLALSTWLGLSGIGACRGWVGWVSVVWVWLRQSVR